MKDYGTKIDKGIYLKKGKWGYRLNYPWKDEEGYHSKNILLNGSWGNFGKLVLIIGFLLLLSLLYAKDTSTCRYFFSNICDFSFNISSYCSQQGFSNNGMFLLPNINSNKSEVIGDGT